MPYRLIAIDIDGTLLDDNKTVTEKTARAIRQAIDHGAWVTLCTGRGLLTSAGIVRQLALNAPLILNGGALIFDACIHRTLYVRNLSRSAALDAVHHLRALRLHPVVYAPLPESQYFYFDACDPTNRAFQRYVENNPGRAQRVDDVLGMIRTDPAMVAATDRVDCIHALAPDARARLPEMTVTLEISPTDHEYCHLTITPHGVSKGSGLRELALLLGIDLAETIAVGDNLNDLDMLTIAGLGVAMGNAVPEAKARAAYVTASNNDDGVAKVIERFILNGQRT